MQENVAPEKHKGSPDYFPEFALLFVVISNWNISLENLPFKGHLHQFSPLLLSCILVLYVMFLIGVIIMDNVWHYAI